MKKYFVLIATLIVLSLPVRTMAETGNVWVMPCTEIVANYQDFPAKEYNQVVLGRGETEHVQLVFSTIPTQDITVTSSSSLPAIDVQYRIVREIDGFDDALVPFESSVKAEATTSVVWLTFETRRDCPVGTYDYSVKVKTVGVDAVVNFKIRVADYEIPLTPSIPSIFSIDIDNIPDNGSDRQKELWTEFLLSRRIDPYYSKLVDKGAWRWDNCFSPWAWDDPRSLALLEDERFCRFALPFMLEDEEIDRMCSYMKQEGVFDRCYFYIWDEPKKTSHYDQIAELSSHLHSIDSDAKMLVPVSSYLIEGDHKWDYNYTFDFLSQYVEILPVAAEEYKGQNAKAEEFRDMIEPRSEWWTYVCCYPKGGQPNFLLEGTPFHTRAIMWRVWREQESGFLYWGVNRYQVNPFEFDRSLDAVGDGALVFPGGLFGIEEQPIASVRLEQWKEGQEDYELLKLVEQKIGRENAERVLNRVYRTPTDFANSSEEIEDFRNSLIQIMEAEDLSTPVVIRGELCEIDTLNAYVPGPGCEYVHIRIDNLPVEAHILKLDLQNPYSQVKTFLGQDVIDGLETVSSACDRYTTTSSDAYAGINGDFFNIAAHHEYPLGAPRGGCASDGVIQREPRSIEWAFAAIDYDNKPILNNLEFEGSVVSLKAPISSYTFNDVNLPRTDCYSCDMTFYNEFAGGYTRMDENANIGDKLKTEVFFKLSDGQSWEINAPKTCVVTRIIKDTNGHNALEEGESALSGIDGAKEFLDNLTVGQKLKINMTIRTADGEAPKIKEMVGGNSLLMKDREIMDCNFTDSYNNVLYPRTGIGSSADGRWLYLMAIDGRQSHSRGVYADEMCDLFRCFGASDVVGLDGGGSTGMVVNHAVVNKPSDGEERAVTNGWLLRTSAPFDEEIARIAFNYWNKAQINSLTIPLNVLGYNQYDVLIDPDLSLVTFSCSSGLGHIEGETLFIDGPERKGTVTASYNGLTVSRYLNLGDPTHIQSVLNSESAIKFYKDASSNRYCLTKNDTDQCRLNYTLYTISGDNVRQGSDDFVNSYCFDFAGVPSGIYLLRVNWADDAYTFKLVIR